LTIARPFVDRYVKDVKDYKRKKADITADVQEWANSALL
jgi:S-adenosylmethionine synthetase